MSKLKKRLKSLEESVGLEWLRKTENYSSHHCLSESGGTLRRVETLRERLVSLEKYIGLKWEKPWDTKKKKHYRTYEEKSLTDRLLIQIDDIECQLRLLAKELGKEFRIPENVTLVDEEKEEEY